MKKAIKVPAPFAQNNGDRPFLVEIFVVYNDRHYRYDYRYRDNALAIAFANKKFGEVGCFCVRVTIEATKEVLLYRIEDSAAVT